MSYERDCSLKLSVEKGHGRDADLAMIEDNIVKCVCSFVDC